MKNPDFVFAVLQYTKRIRLAKLEMLTPEKPVIKSSFQGSINVHRVVH